MYGCTALHLAASKGSLQVVRALLRQNEIEVDPVDNGGRSPLHLACVSGYDDVMNILLQAGALESRRDKEGYAGGASVMGWASDGTCMYMGWGLVTGVGPS